jgi:hypothetical protein
MRWSTVLHAGTANAGNINDWLGEKQEWMDNVSELEGT